MAKAWVASLVLLATVVAAASSYTDSISPDDLEHLRLKIWKLIEHSEEPGCPDCGTPLLAQLVRLSFHDCVGGCDGVLDTKFGANAGLTTPIAAIEPLFEKFHNDTGGKLSRADFWALAGTLALYRGAANQDCLPSGRLPAFPSVPFLVGRKDGGKPEDESQDFPNPLLGVDETTAWAKRVFGFDKRSAVAIMGAHTLGRGRRTNSGFEHAWTSTPDVLDNSYYYDLADAGKTLNGWEQIAVEDSPTVGHKKHKKHEDKHYQWVHATDKEGLMLNSDMCLYQDIEPEAGKHAGKVDCAYGDDGQHSCGYQEEQVLPIEPGEEFSMAELVDLYAHDNYKWMQDFSRAFTTMIQTGHALGSLSEVPYLPPLSCTPNALPTTHDIPIIT